VVEGLELEATARNVERVGHHLKKAAAAGQVVQTLHAAAVSRL
jgi:hypothetical protein